MQLETLQLNGAHPGPHLLIVGGVHGDEFEPMWALRRLAAETPKDDLRGTLTIVPVVNQEAFELGDRCASDGLDLARTCPGRADGSITERVADALSQLIRAADAFIDLHTGGTGLVVTPLTGYMLHPDQAILERQREMAKAFNLPLVWGTDYRLQGRSLSVARDANVPAIYAEYLGGARCTGEGVQAYLDGCRGVMGLLNMIPDAPPTSQVREIVEDQRESSGHLQICNPAPLDGFFESAVGLDQQVEAGELLGRVTDATGLRTAEVRSPHAGLVIVLRTFCQVRAGDSVAVVLERREVTS